MRKIRNIFLNLLLVFALICAAFPLSACSSPRDGGAYSLAEESSQTPSDPEPEPALTAFGSYEEAEKAIYALKRAKFETGAYDRSQIADFENACVDAVMYLRHNKEDEDYLQKCFELYCVMYEKYNAVQYLTGDVPRVYINTSYDIREDKYVKCTVSLVDKTGGALEPVKDTSALIKIRGNSTAGADKKPYNVKLSADTNVFGMESGSKWALLANHFDKTLIRNKLAFDLAAKAGGYATPDSRFCEVYLNGKLLGSYLVCEPVTDGKHRANIDIEAGEFMVERVKAWASPVSESVTTSRLELRFDIEYGKSRSGIAAVLNAAEDAVISGDETEIRKYVDIDSFAAMYITHELLKDCDLTYGSTYLCCKDGKLYFGPLWDMDLSAGNVSVLHPEEKYYIYNNTPPYGDCSGDSASGLWARQDWFEYLCKCPFFMQKIGEEYARLTPFIESLYAKGGYIDSLVAEYGASFARNYGDAGWELRGHASPYESHTDYTSYEQAVNELKDWLRRRHEFLKKEFE